MNELLLELFSEEIPARMQTKATEQILSLIETEIKALKIEFNKSLYFVTPRRIFFYFEGIPSEIPAAIIEKKGPKIDAKEEAITGFLRSVGMEREELTIVDGCYYAKKLESAKPVALVLKSIIEQILISFTWPKSMRLGNGSNRNRWVRPLRNILCLFAGEILPVEFSNLKANNYTYGHRFMAAGKLEISNFQDYLSKMNKAWVMLDGNERQNIIVNQAHEIAKKLNLNVVLDPNLLSEVVGLVEYPNVLLGKIDKEFINLPKEALISVMKTHQRYFYLEDERGNIAPYFIFVANVKHDDDSLIISGNEKVLKARFADAKFFWEQDLKQPVSLSLAKLAKMTFHHKLGNMFDKTNRIIALAEFIAEKIGFQDLESVKIAGLLAKTDLVSEMVGEFPELQGIMGSYYAKKSNESQAVAQAIAEHYRPIDTNDQGDISLLGTIIAISDKLDSIIGLWLAGEKPTSSKDPFALRRAALGIIKLIKQHKLNLSLHELITQAINEIIPFSSSSQTEALKASTSASSKTDTLTAPTSASSLTKAARPEIGDLMKNAAQDPRTTLRSARDDEPTVHSEARLEIITFFNDRLKYYLKSENFRHDLIMASLNENSDNIYTAIENLNNLETFLKTAESANLVFAIKRILKILADSKDKLSQEVKLELFKPAEQNLYDVFSQIKKVNSCEDLKILVPAIDRFFVEIMVNDSDADLRKNRLNLLNNIAHLSKKIADFNYIEA